MTREIAFALSNLKGHKITHTYFTPEEWIRVETRGQIVTNDGYITSIERFNSDRQSPEWNSGWSIYNS